MRRSHLALAGTGAAFAAVSILGSGRTTDAAPVKQTPKPAVVELGRRLFMDPTASRLGKNSCASCHDPERAFGDPRANSPDDRGPTRRHSQTLVDLTGDGFHWDGEFRTVRELLVARVAPAEMANAQALKNFEMNLAAAKRDGETRDGATAPAPVPGTVSPPPAPSGYGGGPITPGDAPVTPVAERLAEDGRYAEAFKAAYGTATPTIERVLDAMDAYCASIRSGTNAFDRFLAGDDAALSPAAQRGLALFEGRANCASCHVTRGDGVRAPLTDGKFHDTGVAYHKDARWAQGLVGAPAKDRGRAEISFLPSETAAFKTPTLRDVAVRAPYMHDGSFASLTSVVLYYAQGGTANPNLDTRIRPIDLESTDVTDLVAFLESLTGSERAGLGMPLRNAAPLKLAVEDLNGNPMSCLTIRVKSSGDRLKGAETVDPPAEVMTGLDGTVAISRPLSTHVVLASASHELGLSRPIPDTCGSQTLIATPKDTISLRIRRTPDAPDLPKTILVVPTDRPISMGTCGPSAVTTLTKIRSLPGGEALYAGKAIAAGDTRRCTLVFDGGRMSLVAEVRLGGGACESIRLEKARIGKPGRGGPQPPPGGPAEHDPGEPAAHGTERDSGPRDVGDRR